MKRFFVLGLSLILAVLLSTGVLAATDYPVTVTNGYGGGYYMAGDEVAVVAMSPMGCTAFDKWVVVSGNVTLADETASVATFTMPDDEVTLEATYKEYHADVSRASCAFRGTCADCGQEVGELGDHWYVEEAWGYRQADGHAHLCEFCYAHTTPIPHTYDDNGVCTDPACRYVWTAPLYIGGVAMEDGDYLAVGATEVSSSRPAGGYAWLEVQDSGAVQLTLHDFSYTGRGRGVDANDYAAISSKNSMTVLLEGDNTICGTSEEYGWDYGIFGSGNIEIRGDADASLQVTADEMALCAAGELTVSGGAKVTFVGQEEYAVNANSIDFDWETYYIYASRDADGSTRENFYLSGLSNYKYLRLGSSYRLDITVLPEGSGTVTGAGDYAVGSTVTVTATPAENFVFVNWSGTGDRVLTTDKSYTFGIMDDTVLYANFKAHTHNWSTDWVASATHHWHICESADCDILDDALKNGYGKHIFVDGRCICGITTEDAPFNYIGDVDKNSKVDTSDLVALMKHIVGAATVAAPENGDINSDGVLDILDIILLLRHLAAAK